MSKLQELRSKNKRNDLLFVGMGMATLDMPEIQKNEDLKTYNNLIKPLRNNSVEKFFTKV